MIKNLIINCREKFNTYYGNVYFRAIVISLIAFFCLRIFTSSVLIIENFLPGPSSPYSGITQETLSGLEQQGVFSRLFLAPWYRWDIARYLEIADFGYDFNLINTVWPPLYPFLIKIFSFVFQPSTFAAILVANIFFIVGLFLTFIFTKSIFNEETARQTIFLMSIFPTSFYFLAGYSESIFLTLSVGVFLLIGKKKWLWAGLLSALAALTRVQGIILVVPIFIELIRDFYKDKNLKQLVVNSFSCFYAPFAYGLYSLYVFFGLRVDWPWNMLEAHWEQHFGLPWEGVYFTLLSILGKNIHIDYTPNLVKIVNILLSLFSIYILIAIRKKIPLSLSIYSWTMLILVMGKIDYNNTLISTARYLLTIFPIFMGMSMVLKNRIIKTVYFSISMLLQTILLIFFFWFVWVA